MGKKIDTVEQAVADIKQGKIVMRSEERRVGKEC